MAPVSPLIHLQRDVLDSSVSHALGMFVFAFGLSGPIHEIYHSPFSLGGHVNLDYAAATKGKTNKRAVIANRTDEDFSQFNKARPSLRSNLSRADRPTSRAERGTVKILRSFGGSCCQRGSPRVGPIFACRPPACTDSRGCPPLLVSPRP